MDLSFLSFSNMRDQFQFIVTSMRAFVANGVARLRARIAAMPPKPKGRAAEELAPYQYRFQHVYGVWDGCPDAPPHPFCTDCPAGSGFQINEGNITCANCGKVLHASPPK